MRGLVLVLVLAERRGAEVVAGEAPREGPPWTPAAEPPNPSRLPRAHGRARASRAHRTGSWRVPRGAVPLPGRQLPAAESAMATRKLRIVHMPRTIGSMSDPTRPYSTSGCVVTGGDSKSVHVLVLKWFQRQDRDVLSSSLSGPLSASC